MLPGLVFLILFGFEVILGGIITEPWPFPVRLIWLGMAFLIRANFQSAVFWGGLGGTFKDSLSHGLLGLEGFFLPIFTSYPPEHPSKQACDF